MLREEITFCNLIFVIKRAVRTTFIK